MTVLTFREQFFAADIRGDISLLLSGLVLSCLSMNIEHPLQPSAIALREPPSWSFASTLTANQHPLSLRMEAHLLWGSVIFLPTRRSAAWTYPAPTRSSRTAGSLPSVMTRTFSPLGLTLLMILCRSGKSRGSVSEATPR